jgi:hypothetical protein
MRRRKRMSTRNGSVVVGLSVAALAAATLALASPAGARPPTREPAQTIPYGASVDCSPYGLHFENVVQGEETFFVETFYDAHGSPTKVVVHDSFRETDTNSVTGKTLAFAGNRTDTVDLVTGIRTVSGRSFLVTDPGRGLVIHDAGHVIFDSPFHVSFASGPHHDPLFGDIDQLACTALAAP